jgi:uncharacterized protein YjbI with pentapeptide repeats
LQFFDATISSGDVMTNQTQRPTFRGGSLEDCNIQGSILQNALFEGVAMYGADLSGCDLSGSEFYLVLAFGASFVGAVLQNARFAGGSYRDADFASADLSGAVFCEDNMGGAVDLSGADFSRAKIDGAVFESVICDPTTKFPVGFSMGKSEDRGHP